MQPCECEPQKHSQTSCHIYYELLPVIKLEVLVRVMLQYYNNIIPSQVIQNTYASRYEGISFNVFSYSISIGFALYCLTKSIDVQWCNLFSLLYIYFVFPVQSFKNAIFYCCEEQSTDIKIWIVSIQCFIRFFLMPFWRGGCSDDAFSSRWISCTFLQTSPIYYVIYILHVTTYTVGVCMEYIYCTRI